MTGAAVMLGLTSGEMFVVAFVTIAVVSAPWWPRAGAAIARRIADSPRRQDPSGDDG